MTRDCQHTSVIVTLPSGVAAALKAAARERDMTLPNFARVILGDAADRLNKAKDIK